FDKKGGPEVTILSQSLARQLWGDENNAVGKRISSDGDKSVEVIGVVGDVKPWGLDGTGDPGSYAPLAQALAWPMIVVARSKPGLDSGSAAKELIQSIRNVVRSIDSGVAVFSVKTMNEIVDTSLAQRRFYMTLMSILAGLSFLLAAIGTYGVISYSVAERTQEIGIRMALGASRHEILTLVVGQGFKLAVVGSAIGVIAAVSVTRVIESFLFNIKPRDPITFAAVSAFLVAVALAASYLPARRATKVDPNSALRLE
ncbi:MAG TPA: FtsX-like permease family protein, partial [Blastocatellia bacterium]|nr:FtsX-like permease family protein [Blastocatellia bacterium]